MRINREHLALRLSTGLTLAGCAERATGRSTVLALRAIADAIEKAGEKVDVRDHHGTATADEHLMHMVQGMVEKLGLRDFRFSTSGRLVACTFVEVLN